MDSVSKQSLLFCPRALFNKEDEFRFVQFGEPPILSDAEYEDYHLRPLDLCNNNVGAYDLQCCVCINPLEGTIFFFCKECPKKVGSKFFGYYHKECIEHISKHPYHPNHSLRVCQGSIFYECLCCSQYKDWVYHCSICDFTMCQDCAREPPLLEIDNPKRHEHTLFCFNRKDSLTCDICAVTTAYHKYLMYSCHLCTFVVHKKCVYFPNILRISRHEHRLSFNSSLTPEKWLCKVCREKIDTNYGRYHCVKGCNYIVHSYCATQKDVWDGKELEGKPEDAYEDIINSFNEISDGIIQHFSHQNHHMRLDQKNSRSFDENKRCQACTLPICDDIIYNCMQCDFILHKECAHLPRKKQQTTHPHPLSLQVDHQDGWFVCTACRRKTNGFVYLCYEGDCSYELDVRCASIAEPLDLRCHSHLLFLTAKRLDFYSNNCSICLSWDQGHVLHCGECDTFTVCFRCATLPNKLRYKHDEHVLILSYEEDASNRYFITRRKKTKSGQHFCEVCEKEADPKGGIYMCNDCNVTLHIKCLLGKDIYMMPSGEIKLGKVNVNIRLNNRLTRNVCWHCHNRCQGKIIFKIYDREILCSFNCLLFYNVHKNGGGHTPYKPTNDRVMQSLCETTTDDDDNSARGYSPYESISE